MAVNHSKLEACIETREKFPNLTEDEFLELAATMLVTEKIIPVLQDAMGLNGEIAKNTTFPLTVAAQDLAESIVSDVISLQERLSE